MRANRRAIAALGGALALAGLGGGVVLFGGPAEPPPATERRQLAAPVNMFEPMAPDPPAPQREPEPEPILTIFPSEIALGNMLVGTSREAEVTIGNRGGGALNIAAIELAGGPRLVKSDDCVGRALTGGETCTIRVRVTAAVAGAISGKIVIVHGERVFSVPVAGVAAAAAAPPAPPAPTPAPAPPPPPMPSALEIAAAEAAALRQTGRGQAYVHTEPLPPTVTSPQYHMEDSDYASLGLAQTFFTYPVGRSRVITEDRYIAAVLENSINSQLPGRAIAVIARHVYGSDDRQVLIPAGTRAVGDYVTLGETGETRLAIVWQRLIRPDGASIIVQEFEGADQMGRTGLIGEVDNRLFERFGTPLLLSVVSAATAAALQESPPGVRAAQRDIAGSVSQITAQVLEKHIDLAPVIAIPAGAHIIIIPTHDLWLRAPLLLTALPPLP